MEKRDLYEILVREHESMLPAYVLRLRTATYDLTRSK